MKAPYEGWLSWSSPVEEEQLERKHPHGAIPQVQEEALPPREETSFGALDDPDAPEPSAGDLVIAEGPSPELAARVEEAIFEQTPPEPRLDAELQPPTGPGTHRGEVREHDGVLWRWARQHRRNGEFRADDGSTSADEAWHWVRTRKHTAAGGR